MELRVVIAGKTYEVDLSQPRSLAIALDFNGPQPNFFGASPAQATPLHGDGFVGATQQGGGCNVVEIRMVPHCNGTHTESAAHIDHAQPAVFESLPQSLMPAALVSVTPVAASGSDEAYHPEPEAGDALITQAALRAATTRYSDEELTALIVRTLPNDTSKTTREYGDHHRPAFFTADAMRHLVQRGVQHLLVDIPSIDKMHDEGKLTNHRVFWNMPEGAGVSTLDARPQTTVTEMIFVDDAVTDGLYLLDLQIPAFRSDAAPSRPILYSLVSEC